MGNPYESVAAGPDPACQQCGTPAPETAVTWMVEHTARGLVVTCPACARTNLRAIEAKLDQEYW